MNTIICALLNRKEVAKIANVHTETIKRWEKRGMLPALKINARVTRYKQEDVEKLLAQSVVNA